MQRYSFAVPAVFLCGFLFAFSDSVHAQNTITVSPSNGLVFTNVPSGSLQVQTMQVSTPTPNTVAVQVNSPWLVVNRGQDSFNTGGSGFPTTLPVEVNANGLAPGPYAGSFA